MGWILLLLVIIICVGTYINSRNEKKKQSQLWAQRQKDSYGSANADHHSGDR